MPFKIKSIKNEKGMTLLEVMAALVLLAILATSVLAIFTPTAMWINKARNQTTAANYAFAILENLRADRAKLDEIGTNTTADDLWTDHSLSPHSYKPQQPTDINADIEKSAVAGLDDAYTIKVTVTRTGDAASTPLAEMVTIIRKE